MNIFVIYNSSNGEIQSVSKMEIMPEDREPFGRLDEGESVIEVPATEELLKLDALDIHEHYKVDVEKKELIKKE